jgi:hypothetical protein
MKVRKSVCAAHVQLMGGLFLAVAEVGGLGRASAAGREGALAGGSQDSD